MAKFPQNSEEKWRATVDRVVPSIVTIKSSSPYPFDTDRKRCKEATGFVVDSERGLILTNRHMVGEGPFWGRAVFQSGAAECLVKGYYIDPLHDYAFLSYKVQDLQGLPLKPIRSINLRPDLVKIGLEIRVMGNDAGATMSILPGIISKVDVNPPGYGFGYNDYRKFWLEKLMVLQ